MVFLVVAMVVSYCLCLSVHLSVCLYVHLCTCNGWGREDQLESVTYVHMYMCTVLSTVRLHVVLCVCMRVMRMRVYQYGMVLYVRT